VLENPHDQTGNALFFRAAAFGCVFHLCALHVDLCPALLWKRPGDGDIDLSQRLLPEGGLRDTSCYEKSCFF
jgi:hypothetical protein